MSHSRTTMLLLTILAAVYLTPMATAYYQPRTRPLA